MIQVKIATSTISANRIVYADGSVNPPFFTGSTGAATACSLNRNASYAPTAPLLLGARHSSTGDRSEPRAVDRHRGGGADSTAAADSTTASGSTTEISVIDATLETR
jgi:hypothetical protein